MTMIQVARAGLAGAVADEFVRLAHEVAGYGDDRERRLAVLRRLYRRAKESPDGLADIVRIATDDEEAWLVSIAVLAAVERLIEVADGADLR